MRSVLLVKTSSLGDVVHNLPVVSDIQSSLGNAAVDWVVEGAFAAIPALHPGVRNTISCELRRWRSSWLCAQTRAEWRAFLHTLRAQRYDVIVDTQGLLKSALVACLAVGTRCGYDWRSSREPLRLFYDRTFSVPWSLHAVERNRRLAGLALNYEVAGPANFGLRGTPSEAPWLPRRAFLVLLHATSHPRKLWPEANWIELGRRAGELGYELVIPWGSQGEQGRARRLAAKLAGATVPERLDLARLAGVLAGAAAVVGVDTGLTHLAAALDVPTVGIYGSTDPQATGVYGSRRSLNLGGAGRFPAVDEVMAALAALGVVPQRKAEGF